MAANATAALLATHNAEEALAVTILMNQRVVFGVHREEPQDGWRRLDLDIPGGADRAAMVLSLGARVSWQHSAVSGAILFLIVLAYLGLGMLSAALVVAFRTSGPRFPAFSRRPPCSEVCTIRRRSFPPGCRAFRW